ncbi:MAG: cytochrome C [Gammaproteobacteria bacterium]|nr:cytochrome C [Gammaproteobacteria bacterium]
MINTFKLIRIGLICACLSSLLFALVPAVNARDDGEKLVEQARCYMCHQLQETLLGPPYVAIAVRHAAHKDVMVEVLAHKIVHGGGGNWGLVPMVPNQWVSLEEARVMAAWILKQEDKQK